MIKIAVILFILNANLQLFSQNIIKLELLRVDNRLILPENYQLIKLPDEVIRGTHANTYDPANPDTFVELLKDVRNNHFQIIIQTDFFGNLTYASVCNSLGPLLNKKTIPYFLFERCLKELNSGFLTQQENIQILINCTVDRLENSLQK